MTKTMFKRFVILGALVTLALSLYAALFWKKIDENSYAGGSATGNAINVAQQKQPILDSALKLDSLSLESTQATLTREDIDSNLQKWLKEHKIEPQRIIVLNPQGNEQTAQENSWQYPYKDLCNIDLKNGDFVIYTPGEYSYPKQTPPLLIDSLWLVAWPLDSALIKIDLDLAQQISQKWFTQGIVWSD